VLHIRGFSGAGLAFVTLLAACFTLFSVECRSLEVALAMVPDPKLQRVYSADIHQPHAARRQACFFEMICPCLLRLRR
jgi:hypothetical protein